MIAALLINFLICGAVAVMMAFASNLLGPRQGVAGDKGLPYETGVVPIRSAFGRMTATYHRFALLFVVFDVDLAFLVPFVLLRPDAGPLELASFTVFISLIALTLALVWSRGALNCD